MSDTRTHAGPTPAGMVLGSYRILHELTSGGMGTVFRAEHVLLGRPAAVKLLRRELSTSPALVQRFVNEARAVTACKHPGIVEAYDFGYTEDGHAFIVMELLDGESLGRRLSRGRLAELEAAAIGRGVASALRAAHRVGVIHRDLKPDNVFLIPDPDGGVDRTKVLDFGIAKLADGGPGGYTQTGALIGTPLYMAPEQARAAAAIDHRADLYSLGCILYHMLTGRPPFVAEGAGEIIALQMFGEVVPPGQLAPVTPEMERLVLRLLDKDPDQRPGNAGEVASALDRIGRQPTRQMTRVSPAVDPDPGATAPGVSAEARELAAGSSALPLSDPRTTIRVPRRSALPVVAGVICVIAIAALGVNYATHGEPDRRAPASLITLPPGPAQTPAPTPTSAAPPTPAPAEPRDATPPLSSSEALAPAPASAPAPAASPPGPAPPEPRAAPDGHVGRKHPAHQITHGVGSITPHAGQILPEQSGEVHRGNRQPDPPSTGDHSPGGAPLEDTVDLDRKPTPRGNAPPATPPPPKDPRSP